KAERNRRVDEVLAELSLTAHADTRTDRLSGGQQKRVNVALELMTKPSLLFLDEPTSGLDPGLDKSVMEMMSGLAKDGRTVIVVTHSVANLDICDRLLVLVPGGKVAYFGPPQDGLKHFAKPGWAEVFQSFDAEPGRDWAGEYRRSAWYQQYVLSAVDGRGPSAARPPRVRPARRPRVRPAHPPRLRPARKGPPRPARAGRPRRAHPPPPPRPRPRTRRPRPPMTRPPRCCSSWSSAPASRARS